MGIEGIAKTAKASVDAKDNQAYTYLRVTAGQTVAAKDTALINDQIGSAAIGNKRRKKYYSQNNRNNGTGTVVLYSGR